MLKEFCNPAVHCAGLEGGASGTRDDLQTTEGNASPTNMHVMRHSSVAETHGTGTAADAGSTQRNSLNSDDVLDDLAGEDDAAELPEPDKQHDPSPSDMFAGLSLSG